MNEKTKLFVRTKFEEYYSRARISIPKDFWMREWGFVFLDHYFPEKLVMRRHKSFATEKELVNYLRENAPAHAYHSAAIYKYPAADMANKGWLGADLIFDLDADHVVSETELEQYSYEDLLVLVKKETEKLIDFMLDDFGFHEKDMELVFSGSRGYHIHIGTEEVRGLGSRERREIVDYVMATGLDMNGFIDTQEAHSGKMRGSEDLRLVPEGWGKRLLDGLIDLLHEIAEMEEEKAIEKLKQIAELKGKNARNIIKIAKDDTVMVRIEKGQIPRFGKQRWEGITKAVTKTVRVKSADRVDEPVTSDIKRLIRLPNSLHGKSSLEVKPLSIETFAAFNPLDDAVVFGDSPVEISVGRNSAIKLKGETYKVEQGEVVSVPEHVAVYFMCRGVAEI